MTGVRKEKLESLFDLVTTPGANVVVVYGIDSLWEKSKNDLQALGNLMMLGGRTGKPGNGILLLRDFANAQGLLDMGVDPKYLPGYVQAGDATRIAELEKLWGVALQGIFRPVKSQRCLGKGSDQRSSRLRRGSALCDIEPEVDQRCGIHGCRGLLHDGHGDGGRCCAARLIAH